MADMPVIVPGPAAHDGPIMGPFQMFLMDRKGNREHVGEMRFVWTGRCWVNDSGFKVKVMFAPAEGRLGLGLFFGMNWWDNPFWTFPVKGVTQIFDEVGADRGQLQIAMDEKTSEQWSF